VKRLERRLANHFVALELPADLPLVTADPLLTEQALVNLLDNAAKYAPARSTIRVSAEALANRVLVHVQDEGTGIPEEALPHIFDKFYRAKASDRRIAGTGLGLAVARGFVEAFGGSLKAANRQDRTGAVMTIALPIAAVSGKSHE
jgi:two-component system sensor histidine kinase KdpD